jgi:hypothetical protein
MRRTVDVNEYVFYTGSMSAKAKEGARKQTAFRLGEAELAKLDKYLEHLRAATPGVNVTRSDALRAMILRFEWTAPSARPSRG